MLHYVIEYTKITWEDLKREGFSVNILSALDSVTKRADTSYEAFIQRSATKTSLAAKLSWWTAGIYHGIAYRTH